MGLYTSISNCQTLTTVAVEWFIQTVLSPQCQKDCILKICSPCFSLSELSYTDHCIIFKQMITGNSEKLKVSAMMGYYLKKLI